MTTGVTGTFWYAPLVAVGTAAIFFTTSMPFTTLPNTAYPNPAGVSSPAQLFLTWHGSHANLRNAATGATPTVRQAASLVTSPLAASMAFSSRP